ncbi:unnamed protein product [Blepharisma stoltei]|uniref:Cyclic nucleotide-binding domain-containing protein n=1 Tax=Blepharisma stoltei TaxID=1481888 RepID=A0AAU9IQC0_9CILI|nr:unnamed protein product [Blepharisma stoltei]
MCHKLDQNLFFIQFIYNSFGELLVNLSKSRLARNSKNITYAFAYFDDSYGRNIIKYNKYNSRMSTSYDTSRIIQILQIPSRLRSNDDINYLMNLTAKTEFFKKITEEQKSSEIHKACCQVMTLEEHNPGDVIVNFGEIGSNFYIILKGSASVNIPTKKKVTLNLSNVVPEKLQKMITGASSSSSSDDEIAEIKFDPRKKRRRGARVMNAVDLFSLNASIQEKFVKKNEELDNPQSNELLRMNDLFKDKIDEEKSVILDFLSKQSPETRVVEIETEELTKVSIISEGGSFGELALISDRPRAATLITEEKILLGVITKPNFKKILGIISEKRLNEKVEFLQALPIFSNWTKIALYKLGYYFKRISFKKHQYVYKEGEPANTVYFVKSGEFKITKLHSEKKGVVDTSCLDTKRSRLSSNGTVLRLGKMRKIEVQKQLQLVIKGKNEMIGMEEALENHEKRIHSCQCWSDEGELLCISRDNLNTGIAYPDTWAQIRDKHNANNEYFKHRVTQLTRIEEAKKSLDFSSLSKIPAKFLIKEKKDPGIEKIRESGTNIGDKSREMSPGSTNQQGSITISPKHSRIESTPNPERVKTEESPVDRSIYHIHRRVDTRVSNADSPSSPNHYVSPFTRYSKKSPNKKIIHRRVAPPNFLRNFKSRIPNKRADVLVEELAGKYKESVEQSMIKYSSDIPSYKKESKSYFL